MQSMIAKLHARAEGRRGARNRAQFQPMFIRYCCQSGITTPSEYWITCIKRHQTPSQLDLRHSNGLNVNPSWAEPQFSVTETISLLQAVAHNRTLTHLYLPDLWCDNDGQLDELVSQLRASLKANGRLMELKLSATYLSGNACEHLHVGRLQWEGVPQIGASLTDQSNVIPGHEDEFLTIYLFDRPGFHPKETVTIEQRSAPICWLRRL